MKHYNRTRFACFSAYFTMSSVFCVPPLLFVTFRELYGISYTLLGTLVLTNFCTQLLVDLIFTAFSKRFNYKIIVRVMPLVTSLGLGLYALLPTLFPQKAYLGLLLGTIVFSVASGLSEVLLSPTIAALPSENPQRDMSTLHSLYAFGVVTMVVVSTMFLKLFSFGNWDYLIYFLAALPVFSSLLFLFSPMPDFVSADETATVSGTKKRTMGLVFCVLCIFFGSCAENVMSNWISSYMENALGVEKALGDILGVAMFAVLLGLARISYARFGKKIFRVLLCGMIGASVCYLVVAFSSNTYLAFAACILTGLCTSMLWPGSLIMMEENLPGMGVAAYALMAAGGDLGASAAPQLMGVVIDAVSASGFARELSVSLGITAEQVGLKVGMLVSALFPIVGVVVLLLAMRFFKKNRLM